MNDSGKLVKKWWIQPDLNQRPSDYESPALTAELWIHSVVEIYSTITNLQPCCIIFSAENYFPQHFLYFLPDPQGHGSLGPIFGSSRRKVMGISSFTSGSGSCMEAPAETDCRSSMDW